MADTLVWRKKGQSFLDGNGDPYASGKLTYFDTGTANERTVYQDSAQVTPWSQPITLDSAGRLTASVYVVTGAFKETLVTSADVNVFTEDAIQGAVDTTGFTATFSLLSSPVTTKAAAYPIVAGDAGDLFAGDAIGGDFTFTLPTASAMGAGKGVFVINSGSAGVVSIASVGGETITGSQGTASPVTLNARGWHARLVSDGANWYADITPNLSNQFLAKTGTYLVTKANEGRILTGDASSGVFSFTLPAAASASPGATYTFINIGATGTVTIDGNASETINGATTYLLDSQWDMVEIQTDGTNWLAIGSNRNYGKGGDLTSASPLVIDTDGDYFDVTGTTGFAAMTVQANRHFTLQFDGALTMTHHATNLDLPSEANITTVAGDVAEFFSTGLNTVQCTSYTRATGQSVIASSSINVIRYTSSDTWTKPSGLVKVWVWSVGPGGGGGGAVSSSANQGGGGGGGAACFEELAVGALGATETVTVGTGGAGGAAGDNDGFAGSGATSFGSLHTAGAGGLGVKASTGGAGAGGTATGGDYNFDGEAGDAGAGGDEQGGSAGGGATDYFAGVPDLEHPSPLFTMLSGGKTSENTVGAAGITGVDYGGGGGGADGDAGSNYAGGTGAGGAVMVWEFF